MQLEIDLVTAEHCHSAHKFTATPDGSFDADEHAIDESRAV
jgi:hypothetical protein